MKYTLAMLRRPDDRIDHVLSRLKRIWHYYPDYSLFALVMTTTIFANGAESQLPPTDLDEIEDIAYPEGHVLHGTRDLGMGFDWLEKLHENEPLPPVPIQTADLVRFADYWRRQPQERLGQLLMNDYRRAGLHEM